MPEKRTSRGVSEVLGYALIFSLIVVSIAIVSVSGYASLGTVQSNEQVQTAERAFDVLHDNMADVYAEDAPSRSTEIAIGQTELFLGRNITVRVRVDGTEHSRTVRPIVFRLDGERALVYEAGATIRTNRDGGIVVGDPPLTIDGGAAGSGHAYLQVVRTTSTAVQGLGGGTVLVRGVAENRSVLRSRLDGAGTVDYVEVETPRHDAWHGYFENRDYCGTVSTSGTTVTCTVESGYDSPARLYLTAHRIRVELVS